MSWTFTPSLHQVNGHEKEKQIRQGLLLLCQAQGRLDKALKMQFAILLSYHTKVKGENKP